MHYRVYKLNPKGGIVSGDWIEAESEQQARDRAQALCDEGALGVELWQGVHKLAVLPCPDAPPSKRAI